MKGLILVLILIANTSAIAKYSKKTIKTYCDGAKDGNIYEQRLKKVAKDKRTTVAKLCQKPNLAEIIYQNCEKSFKGNKRALQELESIAFKQKLKIKDDQTAEFTLCQKFYRDQKSKWKNDCNKENNGKLKVQRHWWDGKNWSTTKQSLSSVISAAKKNDAISQFNLGNWYFEGTKCLMKDIRSAVNWLCEASDQKYKMATMALGQIGQSYGSPSGKARELLGKRFGCKLTERQRKYLAYLKKDAEKAKSYQAKVKKGDVSAMYQLGRVYLSDDLRDLGFPLDYKKAAKLFTVASNKGHASAMGALGGMYNRGDGVEQNDQLAAKWTLKSAQAGDSDSMYAMGHFYYDGQGVEQDLRKASQWFTKALNSGNRQAVDELWLMHIRGELTAILFQDLVQKVKRLHK